MKKYMYFYHYYFIILGLLGRIIPWRKKKCFAWGKNTKCCTSQNYPLPARSMFNFIVHTSTFTTFTTSGTDIVIHRCALYNHKKGYSNCTITTPSFFFLKLSCFLRYFFFTFFFFTESLVVFVFQILNFCPLPFLTLLFDSSHMQQLEQILCVVQFFSFSLIRSESMLVINKCKINYLLVKYCSCFRAIVREKYIYLLTSEKWSHVNLNKLVLLGLIKAL